MSGIDVVVTGLGATTPLGGDVASTWDAMLAGRSGVGPLTQEWAAQLTVRIGAHHSPSFRARFRPSSASRPPRLPSTSSEDS